MAAAGPSSIVISPASATIVAGSNQAYTAQGFTSSGVSLGNVTSATSFKISGVGSCTGSSCGATLAGSYTVTGTDGSAKSTAALQVTPGAAATLSVSGLDTPRTAGASGALTVKVLDAHANVVTGYAGTVHFTSSDANAVLPADYAFTAADSGVHKFTGIVLETAGTQSVTVTDTSTPSLTGAESGIVVTAAAALLVVSGLSSPTTAGVAGTLTVTAQDKYGNVVTDYTGTVHLTSSDAAAVLPADYTFTASDAGVHSFSVTLLTAGTQWVRARDTVTSSITGVESEISVIVAAPATLAVSGLTSPRTAGASGAVTVRVLDAHANVVTGYTGTVHFSSSDANAVLPADYTFTAADSGVHKFTGIVLETAGTESVTVTDTSTPSLTGAESGIVVTAAAALLVVSGLPSPITAGVAGTLTITAQDKYGNVVTGYTGTVHLTSSDTAAILPADYTFTAADAGVHSFSVTLLTAGTQWVRARDTVTPSITGVESGVSVIVAAPATLAVSGLTSPRTAGASSAVTVKVLDLYGNLVTGYTGTVHFTSSDAKAVLPADYTFTAADSGVHKFAGIVLETAGPQSVTVTDTVNPSITGVDSGIAVNPAAPTLIVSGLPSPTLAGVAGSLTVTAQDKYGNPVTGYTGTVHFTSSDAKAVLPGDYTFTAADAGVHSFSVTLLTVGTQWVRARDTVTSSITGLESGISVVRALHITGTVTGLDGQPLSNITVVASAGSSSFNSSTDIDGNYVLTVPSGSYTILFSDPSGTYVSGCYSSSGFSAGSASCTPVSVTSDVTGIDVTMIPALQISGTVTGPNDQPLSNITVGDGSTSTTTAADGAYALAVAPGSYTISFQDATGTYASGCYSSGGFSTGGGSCTPVSVTTADVTDVDVTMPLVVGGLDYLVLSPSSSTITAGANQGYQVEGFDVHGNDLGDVTSASRLSITGAGFCSVNGVRVSCSASVAGSYTVTATDGAASGTASLEVIPDEVNLDISGQVTAPDGAPLGNVWVGAMGSDYNWVAWAPTRVDGTYLIPVPPGASYTLAFDSVGPYVSGWYSSSGFTADQGTSTPVSVTASDVNGIDVVMPIGLQISGTVTGPGGAPLANIWVSASDGPGTDTTADGSYSLTVPPGSYTISFNDNSETYLNGCHSSSGFTTDQSACTPVSVTTSDVTEIDVTMPLAVHISGTVTGPDGAPLANISVGASAGNSNFGTNTGSDGTYSLAVPPGGSYTISFNDNSGTYVDGCYSSSGFSAGSASCTPVGVTTSDVAGIDVTMPLGWHISGTITGPDGQPIANMWVQASATSSVNFNSETNTAVDGTYSLAVPSGTYDVSFNRYAVLAAYPDGCYSSGASGGFAGPQGTCTPISVTGSDVTGIDIQVPLGVTISGTVTGPAGQPLSNIDVNIGGDVYATSAADGTYSLTVVPGTYAVQFSDPSGTYISGCYSSSASGDLTIDQNACTPLSVTTAGVAGVNVQMTLGFHISGTVTGPDGMPVANEAVGANGGGISAWGDTSADGSYSIVVPAGTFTISFVASDHAYVYGCYLNGGFAPGWNTCSPVVVSTSDVTGIDVTMPLSVRVSGVVTGPDGAPLAGIDVIASPSGLGTVTAADGTYTLAVLPGSDTLWFGDPTGACASGWYSTGGFTLDQSAAATLDLSGADVTGIDVQMPLASG